MRGFRVVIPMKRFISCRFNYKGLAVVSSLLRQVNSLYVLLTLEHAVLKFDVLREKTLLEVSNSL